MYNFIVKFNLILLDVFSIVFILYLIKWSILKQISRTLFINDISLCLKNVTNIFLSLKIFQSKQSCLILQILQFLKETLECSSLWRSIPNLEKKYSNVFDFDFSEANNILFVYVYYFLTSIEATTNGNIYTLTFFTKAFLKNFVGS